jgi:hypothetical protein
MKYNVNKNHILTHITVKNIVLICVIALISHFNHDAYGQVLSSAGISIDGGFFLDNKAGYTAQSRRIVSPDIFRYDRLVLSMFVSENIYYTEKPPQPYRMQYNLSFSEIRYDFIDGSLALVADHMCNNIYNVNNTEPLQFGWYRFGVAYETHGNRTGMKNMRVPLSDKPFEWIGTIDYRIAAGKNVKTRFGFFDGIANGSARIDLFRLYSSVTYFEGSFYMPFDPKPRTDVTAEIGIRLLFKTYDVIPYAKFLRRNDVDRYNGYTEKFWLFGIRAETLLRGFDNETKVSRLYEGEHSESLPWMRLAGEYGGYIKDKNLAYHESTSLDIEFFRIGNFSAPFLDTGLSHDTLKGTHWPRYQTIRIEPGISLYGNFKYVADVYYAYVRHDEGNFNTGLADQYHMIGFRVMSIGMKKGMMSYGHEKPFTGDILESEITGLKWAAYIENSVHGSRSQKICNIGGTLRYNIPLPVFKNCGIPFLQQTVRVFVFHDATYERHYDNTSEAGLLFPRAMNLELFYRFSRTRDPYGEESRKINYHFCGVRFQQ